MHVPIGVAHRSKRLSLLTAIGMLLLGSCGDDRRKRLDYHLLATDVHAIVAGHPIVLPLVAMSEYRLQGRNHRIDWESEDEQELVERAAFLRRSANESTAPHLEQLSVGIGTYGWSEEDRRSHEICPRLKRDWAKSVCENPWAALKQSAPDQGFHLVDLRRLGELSRNDGLNCRNEAHRDTAVEIAPAKASLLCEAEVLGAGSTVYYRAAIRITGNLGAYWMVWGGPDYEETASQMAEREGEAIRAFALHAIGSTENFRALHETACSLRRPNSSDGPNGPDCSEGQRS